MRRAVACLLVALASCSNGQMFDAVGAGNAVYLIERDTGVVYRLTNADCVRLGTPDQICETTRRKGLDAFERMAEDAKKGG